MAGLNDLVAGGQQGFNWMDRVLETRRTRATAANEKASRSALAGAMAAGPGTLTGTGQPPPPEFATSPAAIPAPDTGTDRIATAKDMGLNVASMDEGGIPPRSVTPAGGMQAEPVPAPNDPDVAQFEAETQQLTGRDIVLGKDWDGFRKALMQKAAAIGDPKTVGMVDEYITSLQTKGFEQNAARAQMAVATGDVEGTAFFLQKAFGFLNDGNAPRIQPVDDGKFVLMPVSEADGKPSGNPVVLDAAAIANLVQMSRDPVQFGEQLRESEQDRKKALATAEVKAGAASRDQRRVVVAEKGQAETARNNRVNNKVSQQRQAAAKAVANAKKTGAWNDASIRAMDAQVNRSVNDIKTSSMSKETRDLYENDGLNIASTASGIMRETQRYDSAWAIDLSARILQAGHEIVSDPDTGELFVETESAEVPLGEY